MPESLELSISLKIAKTSSLVITYSIGSRSLIQQHGGQVVSLLNSLFQVFINADQIVIHISTRFFMRERYIIIIFEVYITIFKSLLTMVLLIILQNVLGSDLFASKESLKSGPVGGNYFGSVFSVTQIICISNFRSLSLIVHILWFFEKYTLVNVTTFVTTLIVILRFVMSQTV